MSVLILVDVKIKPQSFDDLKNWMRNNLHDTRAFDGCNGITIQRNQDDPNNVIFVEDWESRSHYEKYLAFRSERGDIEDLMAWAEGEPKFVYLDNIGV